MRFVSLALVVAALLAMSAECAYAVQITQPQNGETSVEENIQEGAPISLAGHYAVAAGTTATYQWSSIPPGKIKFLPVQPDNHVIRYMFQPGTSCGDAPVKLRVYDPGDNTEDIIDLYPVLLQWSDPSDDRLVHLKGVESTPRTRTVRFKVHGHAPINNLRVATYSTVKPGNPPQQGTGQVYVLAFDGDPTKVTPAGGCQNGLVWEINVPVTAGCPAAVEHTITFRGDTLSAFKDDIEVDLWDYNQPGSLTCFDGIGAVMHYTVCKIDLELNGLDEITEEAPGAGEYLYFDKTTQDQGSLVEAKSYPILPTDLPGYKILIEKEAGASPGRVLLLEGSNAFDSKLVGASQEYLFDVKAKAKSSAERDTVVRIKLMNGAGSDERGGGTCRDSAEVTSVELDISNPTLPPLTAPAVSPDYEGNEFTFNTEEHGVQEVYCRVKTDPDTPAIRSDLANKIEFSGVVVGSSSILWSPGDATKGVAEYKLANGYWQAVCRATELPGSNSSFGDKVVTLKVSDPNDTAEPAAIFLTEARDFQVFYTRNAYNNPGEDEWGPNWYYYWSQTQAHYGWKPRWTPFGSGPQGVSGFKWYEDVGWYYYIGFDACRYADGVHGWDEPAGIDCYAWTVRHEDFHWWTTAVTMTWQDGVHNWQQDPDDDYLTTAWEEAQDVSSWQPLLKIGEYSVNHYDPWQSVTDGLVDWYGYGDNFNDAEDWCMQNQPTWVNGAANAEDWGAPGMQHGTDGVWDD